MPASRRVLRVPPVEIISTPKFFERESQNSTIPSLLETLTSALLIFGLAV